MQTESNTTATKNNNSSSLQEPALENEQLSNRLFHLAVLENNAGVDLYNLGDYDTSIESLSRALGYIQQFSKMLQHHRRSTRRRAKRTRTTTSATRIEASPIDPLSRSSSNNNRRRVVRRMQASIAPTINNNEQTKMDVVASNSSWSSWGQDNAAPMTIEPTTTNNIEGNAATSSSPSQDEEYCHSPQEQQHHQEQDEIQIDANAMYNCALYLRCHGDCWEAFANPWLSCSGSDLARIRASVLFNLGLSNHAKASTMSNAATPKFRRHDIVATLEKAICLYKVSVSTQKSEQALISPLYLMALCNNIGQCFSSLKHHEEANRWNERLLCFMLCDHQKRSLHPNDSPKSNNTCEVFYRNTSPLILRDPCLAPAA